MEKRLCKRLDLYITNFKDDIAKKTNELFGDTQHSNMLMQYVYDYERLHFHKEDFQKRKRVKNVVPLNDRCCAKRASNQQCTRRKKDDSTFCGTHLKGTPHGIMDTIVQDPQSQSQKVEVWAQDIKGIIYYIDKENNVYQVEDVMSNKMNPKIIAKCVKHGDVYSIPDFNI